MLMEGGRVVYCKEGKVRKGTLAVIFTGSPRGVDGVSECKNTNFMEGSRIVYRRERMEEYTSTVVFTGTP